MISRVQRIELTQSIEEQLQATARLIGILNDPDNGELYFIMLPEIHRISAALNTARRAATSLTAINTNYKKVT